MTRVRLPLTIKLPLPDRALGKGGRGGPMKHHRLFQTLKAQAHYEIRERLVARNEWRDGIEPHDAIAVEYAWHYAQGVHPDPDGVITRSAAILDAAQAIGLVANDRDVHLRPVRFVKVGKGGTCLAVTFYAAESELAA